MNQSNDRPDGPSGPVRPEPRFAVGLGNPDNEALFRTGSDWVAQTLTMNLLVFSDLHLEHMPLWQLPEDYSKFDVCIAAGDIDGSPAAAIRRLASNRGLQRKPIVFVAGNHEYYGNVLEDAIEAGRIAAAETGVHFLNGDSVVIDGVKFIGATLWTDFELFGRRELSMEAAAEGMNDHRLIKRRAIRLGHPGKFRLAPKECIWHHVRQRAFIDTELAKPFGGPTVVVTHHAPSARSVPRRFARDALSPAYASDLERVIELRKPTLWVHGHMHDSVDYRIGETRVYSNPKGYGPGDRQFRQIENPAFDPRSIVALRMLNAAAPARTRQLS